MDFDDIERITEQIYEAGSDPGEWSEVTKKLSRLFGGAVVCLDSRATLGTEVPLYASALFDETLRDLHFEEYRTPEENPGVAALLNAQIGAPFRLESFVDARTYDRDPSIRAILQPQSIDKGLLVAIEREPNALSFMNVFRTGSQAPFDNEELKALSFFAKQIARSLRQSRAAARANLHRDVAAFEAGQGWTIGGIVLVDQQCRVLDSDIGAMAAIDAGSGLAIRQARLVSTSNVVGKDTHSLHAFIKTQTRDQRPFVVPVDEGVLTVIEVLRPQVQVPAKTPSGLRAISIKRVDTRGTYRVKAFGSAFGLTDAELRLLDALCCSRTLAEAAARAGVSRETAKTHVAHIYQRAGCSSLAELMRTIGKFQ